MNILIIGLGSIGQRHLRNLKLVEPNSNFFAIRKKNNVPLQCTAAERRLSLPDSQSCAQAMF